MMIVTVTVFGAAGLAVPEAGTKTMMLRAPNQALLVYGELMASHLSTVKPYRASLVLVEIPLVVVSEESLRFSKVRFKVGLQSYINHPCRFAHAALSVVHAVLSFFVRMKHRASSLASHAIL